VTQSPRAGGRLKLRIRSPLKIQAKLGDKAKTARPMDALIFLKAALAAPQDSDLRRLYEGAALLTFYLGLVHLKERDDRRGREPGARLRDDDKALALMDGIARKTKERRPYKLAGLAIDTGQVPLRNAERASVQRRLAKQWTPSRIDL
jgi:hypothetical protein